MIRTSWRRLGATLAVAATGLCLSACGGGGDAAPAAPSTLQGTAAVGQPIVGGAVSVRCAGGGALTSTTDASGAWQVSLSGQTFPCAVQVSGGTVGGAAQSGTFHSVAFTVGTVNITPLTDLVVAQWLGALPGTWFSSPTFTGLTSTAVTQALDQVRTALGLTGALDGANPLTAPFSAQTGDPIDDILEALAQTLAALNSSHQALLAASASNDYSAFASFGSTFAGIYAPPGGVTCPAGSVGLVYSQASAGAPFSDGQTVCFTASTTSLAFGGTTLANPVQNTQVLAPYAAYQFPDGGITYEVVFNNGDLYEINLTGSGFLGQFAAPVSNVTRFLTIQVTAGGVPGPAIDVGDVPPPANEFQFCNDIYSDPNFTGLGSGGTLTVDSCTYSNSLGTINATLSTGGLSIPYVVTYTYR